MPSTKGTLSVKAMRGDAPQADAVVRIANEHWPKLYPANRKPDGDTGAGERLDEILHPAARTDEQGFARFDDLAPGTYRILAAERDSEGLYVVQVDPEGQRRSPSYQGVPLRAGEDRRFTVAVYEQSNHVSLQILQADGEPASWETTAYQYDHGAGFEGASGIGGWIDERGRADFSFGQPGLWRMYVREREIGAVATRVDPPCYEAAGVVAVSPLLENAPPTVLTSRWVERDEVPRRNRNQSWRDAKFSDNAGRVFYADGKTPAFGARLLSLEPKTAHAVYQTRSDALGRFHAKCCNVASQQARDSTEPVIVAMLPGECGATLVPLPATEPSQDWSIILPKAMSLRGRVTVGGKSISEWNNQFRVLAGYEGRGKLDELLSILVTPDKDGSFELAGLTPGHYRIQASMDGIWLSSNASLVVEADGVRSEPLTLDIGRLGVRSVIRCVDRAAKPVVGIQVDLQRPTGPLTNVLWPVTFTSDGAGILNLPPLEAGRHTLHVPSLQDSAKRSEHTITIKDLTPDLRPLELDLVVD
ncbi:MAG: carboxypeptidase-like regulatory domain-containing protein [Pirellulales bacterium]